MRRDRLSSYNQTSLAELFCDPSVRDEVLRFHALSSPGLGTSLEKVTKGAAVPNEVISKIEKVSSQFSFTSSVIDADPLPVGATVWSREESLTYETKQFSRQANFSDISTIAQLSFGADVTERRPYPSGGALYSVEVIVFAGVDMKGFEQPQALHFMADIKKFEKIKSFIDDRIAQEIKDMFPLPFQFLFLYLINLPKSIFKYRTRGYRLSMMEVGAMYQSALRVGQDIGFSSRVYAGFSDGLLANKLGVDQRVLLPAIVQLFGAT